MVRFLFWLGPLAAAVAAQEEPATVLGQPAGWSVEDATTLIDIAGDSALYLEPDPSSHRLAVLPPGRLPLLESRDGWVKVRFGDRVGWVDLDAPPVPTLAPVTTGVETPATAPLELGPGWIREQLGPYTLRSQVKDRKLIDFLARIGRDHQRLYTERYGLKLEKETLGNVVLFSDHQGFLEFQRSRGHEIADVLTTGYYHVPDLVVMYQGKFTRRQLAATLVHELTHLLSWEALRGVIREADGLPRWLDEGLAQDLSMSGFDGRGNLRAEPLGPANLLFGHRLGGLLFETERRIALERAPSLLELMALKKDRFLNGDSQLHYLMSAFLIRYLLSEETQLAPGFRSYLAWAAGGGSLSPDELGSRLGRDWEQVMKGYKLWLLKQRERFGY